MCWVVVSFVRWCCIQNFRPLGPLFLGEVEFLVGGWVVRTAIIVSNPTKSKLRLVWFVVRLGFWQFPRQVYPPPLHTGSDMTLKNALIWEPFVRFKKFKGLIRLEFNFLLFGQTVQHLPCNSGIKQTHR